MQRNSDNSANYKRVTNEQKQELLRLVELHKDVLFGQQGNSGSERQAQRWEFLANEINKKRGPNRNAKEWRKVYANMKALTKKKTATLRSNRAETGGGEIDPDCFLTEEDDMIQRIAGPSCDGIPQQEEPGSMDSFDPNRAIVIFPRFVPHRDVSSLPPSPPEEQLITADHEDAPVGHHQIEVSQSTIDQEEVLSFEQSQARGNNLEDCTESFGSNDRREEEPQIAEQNTAGGTSAVVPDGNSQSNNITRPPRPAAGRRRDRRPQPTRRTGNNSLTMSNVQRALDLSERHTTAFERFISQQAEHNISTQRTLEGILEALRNPRN